MKHSINCNNGIEQLFEIDRYSLCCRIEQCPGSLLTVPMREVLLDPLEESYLLPVDPERH